jgi:tetratricopeptide (TPR) repeat protein
MQIPRTQAIDIDELIEMPDVNDRPAPLAQRLAAEPQRVTMGPQMPVNPAARTFNGLGVPAASPHSPTIGLSANQRSAAADPLFEPTVRSGRGNAGIAKGPAPAKPTAGTAAGNTMPGWAKSNMLPAPGKSAPAPSSRSQVPAENSLAQIAKPPGRVAAGPDMERTSGRSERGPDMERTSGRSERGPVPVAKPQVAKAPAKVRRGSRRSRWFYPLLGLSAIILIAGGVFMGLRIREIRMQKQITIAIAKAQTASKDDTWRGHLIARDMLIEIARAQPSTSASAMVLAERALLAYEFGHEKAEAVNLIAAATDNHPLTDVARGYAALMKSDGLAAEAIAKSLTAQSEKNTDLVAITHYISGRAALLQGHASVARDSLRLAVERQPRPIFQLALAEAHIALWQIADADALLSSLLKAGPLPAAAVTRAVGEFRASAMGGHPELPAQLDAVTVMADKSDIASTRTAAPLWTSIALAVATETQARMGDLDRANITAERAVKAAVDDPRFAERLIAALMATGQFDTARSIADRALTAWPTAQGIAVAMADIDLHTNNVPNALSRLKAPGFDSHVDALFVRGRAHLMLQDLVEAKKDLDAVIAAVPQHAGALAARAMVDIINGDGKTALARLGTVDTEVNSPSVLVLAAGLRIAGELTQAQTLIARLIAAPPTISTRLYQGFAFLEMARLQQHNGEFAAARKSFLEAQKLGQHRARLEAAILAVDDRDLPGGRAELEAIVAEAQSNSRPLDGDVLIELLRARTLSGEVEAAEAGLKLADSVSSIPRWKVLRERGRLALKKGDIPAASAALSSALADKSADAETLLLVANVVESDSNQAVLAGALRAAASDRLTGTGEFEMIVGKLDLAGEKIGSAEASFARAKDLLLKAKALPRTMAIAHLGLAAVAFAKNDDTQARTQVAQALELDPTSVETHLFAADLEQNSKAKLKLLQNAVKLSPNHVNAWILLGQTAKTTNNAALLAQAIAKLQVIAPTAPELTALRNP